MKLLTFRLQGKMAHFRRYYSNSSSLTYSIPPRTTVIGIIAGIMGFERDSYYDLFSLNQCKVTVANLTPIKKQTFKMNLLMIKDKNDFNGSKEHHSQTPTEFILPQNIRTGIIDYQVWFSHRDEGLMRELKTILQKYSLGYGSLGISLGLGTASQLGWICHVEEKNGEVKESSNGVEIDSVLPVHAVEQLNLHISSANRFRLVKEDIPLEFNAERRITESGKGMMLINLLSGSVRAKVKQYTEVEDGKKIMWME